MTPESIGLEKSSLVLGKLSGRAAFKDRLQQIGYELDDEKFAEAFKKFKDLADKQKEILDEDIISLVDDSITNSKAHLELIDLKVNCGNAGEALVLIELKVKDEIKKCEFSSKFGPVDAIFGAIKKLIPHEAVLELYQVNAVTSGTNAQATTNVRLRKDNRLYSANGSSTDVLVASAIAYINCLEKLQN
jgi:2-isopropylmalate synthase